MSLGDASGALPRRIILVALVLFAAGAPLLPSNDLKVAATLCAALALLVGCYVWARTGAPIGWTPLDLPVAAFLLAASLATLFSVDPFTSFFPSSLRGDGLLVYVAYAAMALAAARLRPREVSWLLAAMLASGSLIAAIAVGQYYGLDTARWLGSGGLPLMARSSGTLGNPIFLGGYACLLLPVCVVLTAQGGWRCRGYAAAGILLYAALIGSGTRAAWVGSAGAGVLVVLLLPSCPQVRRRLLVLLTAFAAVTIIMALSRPQAALVGRAASTFTVNDPSLGARLFVWKHTLPLIRERPVLGWGFSTLLGRLPGIGSPEYLRVFGPYLYVIDSPHNEILYIAHATGVAGLAAYLSVWGTVVMRLRSALRVSAPGPRLPAALLASLAAYAVWLQLAWSHIGTANVFWALAGGAVALAASDDEPRVNAIE